MELAEIGLKVCVRCFTYNQRDYIEEAMNSFCMQQTSFPFICCIVDDCSTDGEQEVIRNYLSHNFEKALSDYETEHGNVYLARHKKNTNCFFVFLALNKNLYGQRIKYDYISQWRNLAIYEASCEGDDYWLTTDKLQKQFDALESHPKIDMCSCGTHCFKNGELRNSFQPTKDERILSVDEVILGGGEYVGTNSLMYRLSIFDKNYNFFSLMRYDYFMQILGALRGGIYHLPEYMAAYRMSSKGSWSQSMSKQRTKYCDHLLKFLLNMGVLNLETNYLYHDSIVRASRKQMMYLLYVGLRSDFLDDSIANISIKARIKYLIALLKKFFIS